MTSYKKDKWKWKGGGDLKSYGVIFGYIIGVITMVALIWCVEIDNNNYSIPKDRQMVSYEYTTECRCGGTIEGYQSLVDDYNREECNKCGYHKE